MPGDKLVQSPSEIHQATRHELKAESQGNDASTRAKVLVCRNSLSPVSHTTHNQSHCFSQLFCDLSLAGCICYCLTVHPRKSWVSVVMVFLYEYLLGF